MFFNGFTDKTRELFFKDKLAHDILTWIIYKTNYQEGYEGLKKFECYISTSSLSDELNIDRMRVSRVLKDLENQGFITWIYKSNSRHKASIISLKNVTVNVTVNDTVNVTVDDSNTNDLKAFNDTVNVTVDDTVNVTSSKNISKNISNNNNNTEKGYDKIINTYTSDNELKCTIMEFIKMRKAIKKPMTDRALRLLLKNLDKLSGDDKLKIDILNQSILNSWQGIFPIKNYNFDKAISVPSDSNRYTNTNFNY